MNLIKRYVNQLNPEYFNPANTVAISGMPSLDGDRQLQPAGSCDSGIHAQCIPVRQGNRLTFTWCSKTGMQATDIFADAWHTDARLVIELDSETAMEQVSVRFVLISDSGIKLTTEVQVMTLLSMDTPIIDVTSPIYGYHRVMNIPVRHILTEEQSEQVQAIEILVDLKTVMEFSSDTKVVGMLLSSSVACMSQKSWYEAHEKIRELSTKADSEHTNIFQ